MSFLIKELEKSTHLYEKYQVRSFKKNEIILNAEDRLDSIIILKRGKLKTYSLSENGTKHLMRIYETGGLLGDIEIFTDNLVVCFVEAMEDGEMYVINQEYFLEWMKSDFNISLYIVKQLAEKLISTGIKAQSAARYPLKYQVLLYIFKHINQFQTYSISKTLIVEGLGSNIRSINRILKQLADEGVIHNCNGRIEVEDLNLVLMRMSDYES